MCHGESVIFDSLLVEKTRKRPACVFDGGVSRDGSWRAERSRMNLPGQANRVSHWLTPHTCPGSQRAAARAFCLASYIYIHTQACAFSIIDFGERASGGARDVTPSVCLAPKMRSGRIAVV